MSKYHAAIIDDGISDALQHFPVEHKKNDVPSHGTICALIIKHLNPTAILFDCNVFNGSILSDVTRLIGGINICTQKDIDILNVSIGTIYTSQKKEILKTINTCIGQGKIIVSAAANGQFYSYPAVLPNVIGIVQNKELNEPIRISDDPLYAFDVVCRSSYGAAFISGIISRNVEEYRKAPDRGKFIWGSITEKDKNFLNEMQKNGIEYLVDAEKIIYG